MTVDCLPSFAKSTNRDNGVHRGVGAEVVFVPPIWTQKNKMEKNCIPSIYIYKAVSITHQIMTKYNLVLDIFKKFSHFWCWFV